MNRTKPLLTLAGCALAALLLTAGLVAGTLAGELSAEHSDELKAFICRQLQFCATNAEVPALAALLVACAVVCVGGILPAPWLVKAFAWGFTRDPGKFELTVTLTRWLFPFVAFVSLVSYCEALLNYRGHFFVPKLAPGLVSGWSWNCPNPWPGRRSPAWKRPLKIFHWVCGPIFPRFRSSCTVGIRMHSSWSDAWRRPQTGSYGNWAIM